jgi:hypothetical protein
MTAANIATCVAPNFGSAETSRNSVALRSAIQTYIRDFTCTYACASLLCVAVVNVSTIPVPVLLYQLLQPVGQFVHYTDRAGTTRPLPSSHQQNHCLRRRRLGGLPSRGS